MGVRTAAGRAGLRRPPDTGGGDRRGAEGLEDHAGALGELEELVELLRLCVGVELEGEADLAEADRRVLGDAERAAEVEVALGLHRAGPQLDADRGRDGREGHTGAGS